MLECVRLQHLLVVAPTPLYSLLDDVSSIATLRFRSQPCTQASTAAVHRLSLDLRSGLSLDAGLPPCQRWRRHAGECRERRGNGQRAELITVEETDLAIMLNGLAPLLLVLLASFSGGSLYKGENPLTIVGGIGLRSFGRLSTLSERNRCVDVIWCGCGRGQFGLDLLVHVYHGLGGRICSRGGDPGPLGLVSLVGQFALCVLGREVELLLGACRSGGLPCSDAGMLRSTHAGNVSR